MGGTSNPIYQTSSRTIYSGGRLSSQNFETLVRLFYQHQVLSSSLIQTYQDVGEFSYPPIWH
jgi:hypothetical protein